MSPILNLQQRMAEVGRIRIGKKSAKGFPEKIDTFRFTSQSRPAVEAVAELYGGEVKAWKPDAKSAQQFEVITPAKDLNVTVAPGQTLSQWYELWRGSKCDRRCDGVTEMLSGGACKCPFDDADRRELAVKGQACKPTTRLSVIMEGVPVIGLWRVESHGFYAATELGAMAAILEYATAAGVYVPATLRLQERPGPKGKIYVPVLELKTTIAALKAALSLPELGSGSQAIAALPPAPAPTEPADRKAPAMTSAAGFESPGAAPKGFVDRQTGRIHVPDELVDDVPLPGEEGHPEAAGPRPIVEADDDVVEAEIVEEITAAPAKKEAAGPPIASTVTPSSAPEPAEVVTSGPTEGGASLIGTAPDGPVTPAGDGAFSQGLMIAARKAELDDETRHAIILKITNGRTGSTKEVTATESTELHNVFALLRMKKVGLAFSPEGEVSWS